MRLEQLRLIIEIANLGSLTAAAQKINLSQPNASLSLTSIENELGVKIFSRSRVGASPTEDGLLIIEKARQILILTEAIENIANPDTSLMTGKISIATVPSMCTTILPQCVGIFKQRFPNVQLDIVETGTWQIKKYLLKKEVHVGLVSHRITDAPINESLLFKPLLNSQIMACVSRTSKLTLYKQLSYETIIKYPIVILDANYKIHERVIKSLEQFGKPDILLQARNPASIRCIIKEGLAIGFDAEISLKTDPYVRSSEIIPIHIVEETVNQVGALYFRNSLSAASTEFIKELQIQAASFSRMYNLK